MAGQYDIALQGRRACRCQVLPQGGAGNAHKRTRALLVSGKEPVAEVAAWLVGFDSAQTLVKAMRRELDCTPYRDWLPASDEKLRDEPSLELMLNSPQHTPAALLHTEIWRPLQA